MSLAVVKRTVWPRRVAWWARLRRNMVLPTPLGASSVDTVLDEFEAQELVDGVAVDSLGPSPIEVDDGFECADPGVAQASFEASLLAFLLFERDELGQPRLGGDVIPAGDEAKKSEALRAVTKGIEVRAALRAGIARVLGATDKASRAWPSGAGAGSLAFDDVRLTVGPTRCGPLEVESASVRRNPGGNLDGGRVQ